MRLTQPRAASSLGLAFALALFAALLPTARLTHARQPANAPAQNTPTAKQDAPAAAREDSSLVFVNVAVTDDYGRFMTGLGKDAFAVFEGNDQSELVYFSDKEEAQGVGVVFDLSGSMGGVALDFARGAVVRLSRVANKENEYFLVGFDAQPRLIADWVRDEPSLIVGLNKLGHVEQKKTRSGTALYDAVALALEKVVRGPQPRHVLLVISDGSDNASQTKLGRLREVIKQSDVTVYGVGLTDVPGGDYNGRANLEELAAVSGGRAFFPTTEAELDDTFKRIAFELHNSYKLGFRPKSTAHVGKWHEFNVKVRPPSTFRRVYVRGRPGYYAARENK